MERSLCNKRIQQLTRVNFTISCFTDYATHSAPITSLGLARQQPESVAMTLPGGPQVSTNRENVFKLSFSTDREKDHVLNSHLIHKACCVWLRRHRKHAHQCISHTHGDTFDHMFSIVFCICCVLWVTLVGFGAYSSWCCVAFSRYLFMFTLSLNCLQSYGTVIWYLNLILYSGIFLSLK